MPAAVSPLRHLPYRLPYGLAAYLCLSSYVSRIMFIPNFNSAHMMQISAQQSARKIDDVHRAARLVILSGPFLIS